MDQGEMDKRYSGGRCMICFRPHPPYLINDLSMIFIEFFILLISDLLLIYYSFAIVVPKLSLWSSGGLVKKNVA